MDQRHYYWGKVYYDNRSERTKLTKKIKIGI